MMVEVSTPTSRPAGADGAPAPHPVPTASLQPVGGDDGAAQGDGPLAAPGSASTPGGSGAGGALGGGGSEAGGGTGEPARFSETMTPPVLVSGPPLGYTPQAIDHQVEGTMLVECVVQADGGVRRCRVLKGLPFLDQAIVSALEQRRYRPATLGGNPLDVRYTFTVRLNLPR